MPQTRRQKTRLPPPRETAIVRACLAALAVLDVRADRQNTGVGKYTNKDGTTRYVKYGRGGQPDIVGILDGRYFGLEVKRPGKRPTPEQYERINAINQAGGVAFWIDTASTLFVIIPRIRAGLRVYLNHSGQVCLTDEPHDPSIEGWKP